MQSWSEVRLGLMALGYRRVLTIEIDCPRCGTWRAELSDELEYYLCPVCRVPTKVRHALEGYTKRTIETLWRQIEKPLSDNARGWLAVQSFLELRGEAKKIIRAREHAKRKTLRTFRRGKNLPVTDTRSAGR